MILALHQPLILFFPPVLYHTPCASQNGDAGFFSVPARPVQIVRPLPALPTGLRRLTFGLGWAIMSPAVWKEKRGYKDLGKHTVSHQTHPFFGATAQDQSSSSLSGTHLCQKDTGIDCCRPARRGRGHGTAGRECSRQGGPEGRDPQEQRSPAQVAADQAINTGQAVVSLVAPDALCGARPMRAILSPGDKSQDFLFLTGGACALPRGASIDPETGCISGFWVRGSVSGPVSAAWPTC